MDKFKLQPRIKRSFSELFKCYKDVAVNKLIFVAGPLIAVSFPALKVRRSNKMGWDPNNLAIAIKMGAMVPCHMITMWLWTALRQEAIDTPQRVRLPLECFTNSYHSMEEQNIMIIIIALDKDKAILHLSLPTVIVIMEPTRSVNTASISTTSFHSQSDQLKSVKIMFESPTPFASSHSPHLRKPGGKPVFSDLGAGESGNSVQEGYVFPLVLGDMKGTNSPMQTATAIMPSPIFLWRFKVILFFIWGFTCCKIGWDSVMRMSADLGDLFLYEAFLYYNPLLLMTMMVWLWGVCLWVFSQSTVNYAKIFDLDQNHLTHREIWKVILYVAVALVLVFPFDIFYLSSRYFLLRSLWRIALPLQPISFPDFFLADILTSMSKVFSDLERSVCRMVHRQVATIAWFEADSVCGSHSVAIPLVLVIPYIWRLMQCLRQYKDTKDKATLFNALKYSTAVPVIFLSALKYHVLPDRWRYIYRRLWLFSSVVNSLYSFYWDITRDWDLSVFTRIFKFNKPSYCSTLLYGRQWVYFWVIGSNLILRCAWTYKLSAHLRHNYLTVFMFTTLEMLRRFQWIFFRVENEWNKITKSSFPLPMIDIPREDEKLLSSTNHNV
ncbi:hypothetical protein CRYUN_Cryun20dG0021100 [Craigia yunnanensis]